MQKKHKIINHDLEKSVMEKVKSNQISMKPRWHFVLGSFFMLAGVIGLSVGAVFLTNLTLFLLRQHGPMGQWRLQLMLNSFPLWVPILAVLGILLGISLLKKYDFSYKKNFWLIVGGFIVSIVLTAILIDFLGLNNIWSRKGPMKRFYQQIQGENPGFRPRFGQGRTQ